MSIDLERVGGAALVTVNRPEALNALDLPHTRELNDRLEELAADDDVRVVVLTGAGEKAFVAGADIKYMQGLGVLEARRWGERGHACGELLETMPKIIPGWGGTQRLARATTLAYAKELVFTGRLVDAAEALERGLVHAVYEPGELRAKTLELCETLSAKSPVALAYAKEASNLALSGDHGSNLEAEVRLFALLFSTDDQKEGMAAFVEKRAPEFRGR
jgi:enoyl-CoA hydratase